MTNLFAQNLPATNLAAAASPGSTWTTYLAAGDLNMSWDFGSRTGDLTISKFDASHFNDGQGLSFSGPMCAPGVAGCAAAAGNHFGGPLAGSIDANFRLSGAANGAFVRAPGQLPGTGAIGNWYVSGNGSQGRVTRQAEFLRVQTFQIHSTISACINKDALGHQHPPAEHDQEALSNGGISGLQRAIGSRCSKTPKVIPVGEHDNAQSQQLESNRTR